MITFYLSSHLLFWCSTRWSTTSSASPMTFDSFGSSSFSLDLSPNASFSLCSSHFRLKKYSVDFILLLHSFFYQLWAVHSLFFPRGWLVTSRMTLAASLQKTVTRENCDWCVACTLCTKIIFLVRRSCRVYWRQSQLFLWVKAGYTLDESPAHRRALTDGRGQPMCRPHIRSYFGVQYLAQGFLIMQLSSAPRELGFELLYPLSYSHLMKNVCFTNLTFYIFKLTTNLSSSNFWYSGPDSKIVVALIWPTPETFTWPTSWVEWWHFGSLLLFARTEQEAGHSMATHQPRANRTIHNWLQVWTTVLF